MQYKSVKGFTPLAQLGILFVFLGLGFILAAGAQLIIGLKMLPADVSMTNMGEELMKAMLDPKNVNMARLAQVAGTFFLLFVPVVLYSLVTFGSRPFWLGFSKHISPSQVILGFVIIFVANIMASPIGDLTKEIVSHFPSLDLTARKMEAAYTQQVVALSHLGNWPEYLMALVIMAFFPALFEEMFFRGGMQNILVRWLQNPWAAIIITSLLFSLIHMSVYLFLSRAILGFVLGYMYHKTKNIWVNVIAHFLNNAIAVTQLFWMSLRNEKMDLSKLDPSIDWWYGVLAVIGLVILFRLLKKVSVKHVTAITAREEELYRQRRQENPFITNH